MKKIKIGIIFGYELFIEVPENFTQELIDQIVIWTQKKLK